MGLAGHDLMGQELAGDEAQRRPAMAKRHVASRNRIELAEDRLAILQDRLRAGRVGVELELWVALENSRCLAQQRLDGRVPYLLAPVRSGDDLLLLGPGGIKHEGTRGIAPDCNPGCVQDGAQGDVHGFGPD
jgi:hypothetical protein